jgi:hypothetical protein
MTDPVIPAPVTEGEPVPVQAEAPVQVEAPVPQGSDYRPPVKPEPEPLVQAAKAFPEPVVTEPVPAEVEPEPETFHRGADFRPEPVVEEPTAPVVTLESLAARVAALEARI